MATLLAGDRVLLTAVGQLNGQTFMNTFTYLCSSVGASIAQGDAFTAIRDAMAVAGGWLDKYKACLPNNVNALELWFQVIAPSRYPKYVRGASSPGTFSTSDALTSNVAQVITRRADHAGRKYIGSVHLPCASDADTIDGASLTVGALTILNQFALKVQSDLVSTSPAVELTPSILHKPLTVLPDPIIIAFGQPTVRVMRRRTKGLGI